MKFFWKKINNDLTRRKSPGQAEQREKYKFREHFPTSFEAIKYT